MIASRRTQPYRRGQRSSSTALMAMLRGKPLHAPHPMDAFRTAQRRRRRYTSL